MGCHALRLAGRAGAGRARGDTRWAARGRVCSTPRSVVSRPLVRQTRRVVCTVRGGAALWSASRALQSDTSSRGAHAPSAGLHSALSGPIAYQESPRTLHASARLTRNGTGGRGTVRAVYTPPLGVKSNDGRKIDVSEGILQGCFQRSRTIVGGAKTIRYRLSLNCKRCRPAIGRA